MTATTSLSTLTALYGPLDLDYSEEMSGPYEDLTFRSDECTVIAGLKDDHITGFWRPVVAAGSDSLLKEQIVRLYNICQNITYMDFLIDGNLSAISKFLLGKGYSARPYFTQIIDLTKSKEQLHSELRKSYKSIVNKTPIISVMKDVAPYKRLHAEIKGQKRSPESWFIQQKMLWNGQAFCLLQSKVIDPQTAWSLAGGLFYCNDHCCYYASGCSSVGVDGHNIIWEAILYAKERGCKTFEMGEQVFSGDQKQMDIAKFKRGFGGNTVTRLILERKKNEVLDSV